MERGVYSNGLPHPTPEMRARIATEVGVLALLTALFLLLADDRLRNNTVYIGLALSALLLIKMKSGEIQEKIWGPPTSPEFDRVRRCFVNMCILTIPPYIAFFAYGFYAGGSARVLNPNYLLALALYIPWAMLQQTLFQFYLLGRLRALLPFASPLLLAVINGIAYGLVHLPNWQLAVLTSIGGIFWSYSYHRDRYVLPIALSHAMLGSSYYYWVYDHDLIKAFFERLHG